MTQEMQAIIFSVIGIVLTTLVSWGMERLIKFLNTKIKNEKTVKIFERAIDIVDRAVKSTYQTYVESLKGTDAWTKEAQTAALNQAVREAKSILTAEAQAFIIEIYGNLDEWLRTEIEAKIYDLKSDAKTAVR